MSLNFIRLTPLTRPANTPLSVQRTDLLVSEDRMAGKPNERTFGATAGADLPNCFRVS